MSDMTYIVRPDRDLKQPDVVGMCGASLAFLCE